MFLAKTSASTFTPHSGVRDLRGASGDVCDAWRMSLLARQLVLQLIVAPR
jgi:hypothetical protein